MYYTGIYSYVELRSYLEFGLLNHVLCMASLSGATWSIQSPLKIKINLYKSTETLRAITIHFPGMQLVARGRIEQYGSINNAVSILLISQVDWFETVTIFPLCSLTSSKSPSPS